MEANFRHEYKFAINYSDYLSLRDRLKIVMSLDKNVNTDGTYQVNSLYFDNFHDKALMEKINGTPQREKFRIRYYNQNLSVIHLEKKAKRGTLCQKTSCEITKEECEAILAGDTSWMFLSERPLLHELYRKMTEQLLKPKTIVSYKREPYVYVPGNVRITFDSCISTGISCLDFFNPATIPAGTTNRLLLEVKFDRYLPGLIQDVIQLGHRQAQAFSKYAVSRSYY